MTTTTLPPTTEEIWASVPNATTEDLDRAVTAADRAFAGWAALTPSGRAEFLVRAAEQIEARREPMALTNTRENGSPISESLGAAANAAGIFRYFASLAPWLEAEDVRPFPNGAGVTRVYRDPVGVCALIAPWNFPINLVVAKLAPALLAGCTVVIKPASPTPLSVRFVVDALTAAGVPAGVVNLVTGNGRMGDHLVRHPLVRKVAFTGSTPVGRKIAAACGEQLKPVTLELGGKSSAIVLPDADLEHMSSVLIRSCMRNTGQTCYISTRILAPEDRYEEVVEMVGRTVGQARQGDPLQETTIFGPMANRGQYDIVLGYLDTARTEGARVVTGGGRRVLRAAHRAGRRHPGHDRGPGGDLRTGHHRPEVPGRGRGGRPRQQHAVRSGRHRLLRRRGARPPGGAADEHGVRGHQLLRLQPRRALRRARGLRPGRGVRRRRAQRLPEPAVGAPQAPLSRRRAAPTA